MKNKFTHGAVSLFLMVLLSGNAIAASWGMMPPQDLLRMARRGMRRFELLVDGEEGSNE